MKVLDKTVLVPRYLKPKITIDNSLPDLSNHPVVLRKAEEARKFLEEHPVPEHLLKRR
ncbi:hypothetical protein [Dyadobacter sp. CY343]|jgi:hypothetical protein|uniref:hypothetical protein n=1 Tax=Dyadobacter sp. CY343 TaxID=2907299 RepID=UPI001F222422|nr:hypothetical protein [Dyadobacter sp. CY343]MCE7058692.1 hypothetical protein [Dyadobacter sp. CY343]